ncbi:hypothetical protein F6X40_24115 [Paraburkholderia sp. UCT31]|uniref:hypothetical protein n=1 Tax=Paraburkholderia sp. UCT31 TaxID=2615209 RepID=UPI001654D64A|nr:hypothetical protein [Paraburkholderia sp. UCT31]MBC8739803.1 hypothetical protein [Paraburkholderia sp. UCT31]
MLQTNAIEFAATLPATHHTALLSLLKKATWLPLADAEKEVLAALTESALTHVVAADRQPPPNASARAAVPCAAVVPEPTVVRHALPVLSTKGRVYVDVYVIEHNGRVSFAVRTMSADRNVFDLHPRLIDDVWDALHAGSFNREGIDWKHRLLAAMGIPTARWGRSAFLRGFDRADERGSEGPLAWFDFEGHPRLAIKRCRGSEGLGFQCWTGCSAGEFEARTGVQAARIFGEAVRLGEKAVA